MILRMGFSLAFASLTAGACSLVVATDPYEAGCKSVGKKECETAPGVKTCVALDDPFYGCAQDSCTRCFLTGADTVCTPQGTCGVGTCFVNFGNCTEAVPGCETDLTSDVHHCHGCNTDCDMVYPSRPMTVSLKCSNSMCKVNQCQPGFLDCDNITSTGCEQKADDMHCGVTCKACSGATPTCNIASGTCQ